MPIDVRASIKDGKHKISFFGTRTKIPESMVDSSLIIGCRRGSDITVLSERNTKEYMDNIPHYADFIF